jgi:hypothetical protein
MSSPPSNSPSQSLPEAANSARVDSCRPDGIAALRLRSTGRQCWSGHGDDGTWQRHIGLRGRCLDCAHVSQSLFPPSTRNRPRAVNLLIDLQATVRSKFRSTGVAGVLLKIPSPSLCTVASDLMMAAMRCRRNQMLVLLIPTLLAALLKPGAADAAAGSVARKLPLDRHVSPDFAEDVLEASPSPKLGLVDHSPPSPAPSTPPAMQSEVGDETGFVAELERQQDKLDSMLHAIYSAQASTSQPASTSNCSFHM